MKYALHQYVCLLGCLSISITAHSSSFFNSDKTLTLQDVLPNIVSLDVGPAWSNSAQTQTLSLVPSIFNTYDANHNTSSFVDGELFLGKSQTINSYLKGQFGVAFAMTSNAKLTGDIWQQGEPEFNNLTYAYQIEHTHVALKGKIFALPDKWLQPYLSASLGVGFNNAHNYTNTPDPTPYIDAPNIITYILKEPNFTSHTQTTFTYTVGAGLQRKLTKNWSAGIGYEFADWGGSSLGPFAIQTTQNGLILSHFYTNSVQFNLTYIIT